MGAKEHRLLIIYSTTTAVVVIITLIITSCVRNMTERIGMYARMVAGESAELRRERRRSERLKYRLLPPGVAISIIHLPSHSTINPLIHSKSPTHSLTHSLSHSPTHSLTHPPTHSLTHSLIHNPTLSVVHRPTLRQVVRGDHMTRTVWRHSLPVVSSSADF